MKPNARGGLVAFLLMLVLPCGAQTARELETLLGVRELSWEETARFVMEAAEAGDGGDGAFDRARERGWLPGGAGPGTAVRYDGVSLLLMRAFRMKGGIFYTVFKNPHYAWRELVWRDIIPGRVDPGETVSGENLVYLVGRLLEIQEEEEAERRRVAEEKERRAAERRRRAEERRLLGEINARIAGRGLENASVGITEEGVTISISSIQFLADSADMPQGEWDKLREIAVILAEIPGRRILVAGHTASAGTEEGRQRISQARAQAVADFFVSLGARTRQEITVRGYGATRPLTNDRSEAGMARNRRVEITILEEQ